MNVRYLGVYGGTNIRTQGQEVYNGTDILVGTPGRLFDLAMAGILRFKTIRHLVIDEVDEMLNLGFRSQILSILELLPEKRQNLMFSATLAEHVEDLINEHFHEPEKIEIESQQTPLEQISQLAYHLPNFNTKLNLLELLLSENEEFQRVLVFAKNKKTADLLHERLDKKFEGQIGVIHSNKSQNYRINALKRFKDGENRILIATDIAARGIDIQDVSHVINFQMPELAGDYIHRIGRTGRANKSGIAISFISDSEHEVKHIIEHYLDTKLEVIALPENLTISTAFNDDERPKLFDKDYLKTKNKPLGKGAFHEKKEKNKKTNSGGLAKKLKNQAGKGKKRK